MIELPPMSVPAKRSVSIDGHRTSVSLEDAFWHDLGAAAYAIKAAADAAPPAERDAARRRECAWQRDRLPPRLLELVVDDQRRRNDICWSVFDV